MKNLKDAAVESAEADTVLNRDIDRLTVSIRRFKIDAQRFFAGDLKLPPEAERDKITAELRRLRGQRQKGAAAKFRLGTLESQFQSHLDLFGRRMRQREEGPSQRPPDTAAPPPDAAKGVIVGPAANPVMVKALFKGLYARGGDRSPQMSLERFSSYLLRQAEVIRGKTGCSDIQFRVAIQDGKPKLKARPIRRKAAPR